MDLSRNVNECTLCDNAPVESKWLPIPPWTPRLLFSYEARSRRIWLYWLLFPKFLIQPVDIGWAFPAGSLTVLTVRKKINGKSSSKLLDPIYFLYSRVDPSVKAATIVERLVRLRFIIFTKTHISCSLMLLSTHFLKF